MDKKLDFYEVKDGKVVFKKDKMTEVTSENYFELYMDRQYMNSTQYKSWLTCEAKELARQNGKYEEGEKKAYILGNYLHSWNDKTMEEYCNLHHDTLFKNNGGKYKATTVIDGIINTFENDKFIMFMLDDKDNETEQIFVAEFAGVWWKVRIDTINHKSKRLIDLKTARGIYQKYWSNKEGKYVNFVEFFNYILQSAIYEKVVRIAIDTDEHYECFLVVGSKEEVPDKMVIDMTDFDRFDHELKLIENNMERILKVKYGIEEPERCGTCDYCKATKQLTEAVPFSELRI